MRTASLPNPMIALGACRRDDNGTWWVEVIRVPQPKFAPVRQPQYYYIERAISQIPAPAAKPACCNTNEERGAALGGCPLPPNICMNVGMRESPAASCKFAGTWVREMEGIVVAATLSPCGEELRLCMTQHAEGHTVCLTVTADCKVTKEGLLHGVITGVDINAKRDPKATGDSSFGVEIAEMAMGLQELVDAPFSFRMKQTSAGLMVSNLKMGSVGPVSGKELAILCGMFKPCKDGAIPTPKPIKTHVGGMTLPSGRYLEHYPQYFSPDPTHPLPRELASQEDPDGAARRAAGGFGTVSSVPVAPARPVVVPACPVAPAPRVYGTPPPMACPALPGSAPQDFCPSVCPAGAYGPAPLRLPGTPQAGWSPAQPANVPGSEFDMMADVFGQMLGMKQPLPCVPPPPAMLPPPVQPAGLYLPPGSSYPQGPGAGYGYGPPVPSMVPSVSTSPLPQAKPSLTGTWVREVGPVVYVVKIAPDHLTITATGASEIEDGTTTTEGMILTADYHLSRDGTTLVGLITSVDAIFGGDVPENIQVPHLDELARLQKAYGDKPFALSVRAYGDSLVIGNVRLPQAEESRVDRSPLSILGGRYRNAGDKMLPKPKPMKPGATRAVTPCLPPVGYPVPHYPPAPVSESPYAPPPSAPAPTWSPPPSRPTDGIPPPFPGEAPRTRLGPPATVCPAPGVVPRELDAVTLPPDNRIPPPSPRVTEPTAPPMAVPTPIEPKAEGKQAATEMTVMWKSRLGHFPDPTRNGEKVAGISGQLFLFGPNMKPASAEGELTITLHDDTPRPAGIPGGESERWVIGTDSLRRAAATDERFGPCYTLFLPWPDRRPDVTRVRLSVSFRPDGGGLIHSMHTPETKLTLDAPAKPDTAPESAETPKTKKKKQKVLNQYSTDPNERIQQLLYQRDVTGPIDARRPTVPDELDHSRWFYSQEGDRLRGIHNEWRRFWFNDQPSHMTPERIHGGILK
jgi:hypothetical protein